jgi:hypothetical protein
MSVVGLFILLRRVGALWNGIVAGTHASLTAVKRGYSPHLTTAIGAQIRSCLSRCANPAVIAQATLLISACGPDTKQLDATDNALTW